MTTANPCKLHDGTWGVRITGRRARVGEIVRVETRSGKTWNATIASIVWEGDDVMIASPAQGAVAPHIDTSRLAGCVRGRRTAARTSQIWEPCESCGTEPIYM